MKMCELFVKKCDGMRNETVSESVCVAFDAADDDPSSAPCSPFYPS